jgi:monoamine oxidase
MALSRRSFLAALGASAAAASARAADLDVVIVGAGAAGLAAAHALRAARRNVLVMEARGRIGGRVFTDESLGPRFETGAFYIHWAERNPWTGIAKAQAVETVDDRTLGGSFAAFRNGERLSTDARRQHREAFGRINTVLGTYDHTTDQSFADLMKGQPPALSDVATAIALMSLGEDPQRVSAADYEQLDSGTDLVVPTGYGKLVERYGAGLPVSLSTPVTAIDWSGQGVVLSTANGTLAARAAIVTVPVGVLAREGIRFTPALPAETLAAIDGLGMGAMTKLALKVEGDRLGQAAFTQYFDDTSRHELINFELWPFEQDLIVATFGGDYARGVAKLGEAGAIDHVTERLLKLTGAELRPKIAGGRLAGWSEEPFSAGSYSLAKPGHLAAREALARPVGDRIWFAGEAVVGPSAMTAGGAVLAGQAAAQAIAGLLAAENVERKRI